MRSREEAAIMSDKDPEKSSDQPCRAFEEGEHFQQTDLAQTLVAIAENGRDGFYGGWVAERIVETMQSYDGLISQEYLKAYESVWREPYEVFFRGYRFAHNATAKLWKYCGGANFTDDENPRIGSRDIILPPITTY